MNNIEIRNFQPLDEPEMIALQHKCVDICPDTGKFEAGIWLSPAYENGKNIFVAANKNGHIVGYGATTSAYYSNNWEARIFWMDLRTDPEIDKNCEIKDILLRKLIQRGREIKFEENRERAAVGATYFAQGKASINYLKSQGFSHFDRVGNIFFDPIADKAFIDALKGRAKDSVIVREVDAHIDDDDFARIVTDEFLDFFRPI